MVVPRFHSKGFFMTKEIEYTNPLPSEKEIEFVLTSISEELKKISRKATRRVSISFVIDLENKKLEIQDLDYE